MILMFIEEKGMDFSRFWDGEQSWKTRNETKVSCHNNSELLPHIMEKASTMPLKYGNMKHSTVAREPFKMVSLPP